MVDKFDEALKNYRQQIMEGRLDSLKENLAAGQISSDHKVKAAKCAIQEYEDQKNGTYIFPVPSDTGMLTKLKIFWLVHWKWIIPTLISFIGLYIAYLGIK